MSRRIESMRRNSFATSAGLWAYIRASAFNTRAVNSRDLFRGQVTNFQADKDLCPTQLFYTQRYNGQSYDNPLDTSVSLGQASIYIEISVSGLPTSERWRYRRKCVFPEGLRSIRSLRFRDHISRVLTYFILA
jgi:hypothetical protein